MDDPSADQCRMTRHVIVGGLAAALLATANRMGLLWGCSWIAGRHTPRSSDRGLR